MTTVAGDLEVELDDVRLELSALNRRVGQRRLELAELWRTAAPADRILSVQKLLQQGALAPEHVAALEELHGRARDLWAHVRADRKKLADDDARHQLLRREIECQMAESARDKYISSHGLDLELYRVAESFIMQKTYDAGTPPLREMLKAKRSLEGRLVELASQTLRKRRPHAAKKMMVRMLAPLTMSGEGFAVS